MPSLSLCLGSLPSMVMMTVRVRAGVCGGALGAATPHCRHHRQRRPPLPRPMDRRCPPGPFGPRRPWTRTAPTQLPGCIPVRFQQSRPIRHPGTRAPHPRTAQRHSAHRQRRRARTSLGHRTPPPPQEVRLAGGALYPSHTQFSKFRNPFPYFFIPVIPPLSDECVIFH